MAEGVRIRHHTRRSQMLPVPLLFEPWDTTGRPECGLCHSVHPCKVLHLDLDDTGAVIVSLEVKAKIWRVPTNGGFVVVNPVLHPPPQGIYPKTVKANIRGIDIGGGLEVAEPKRYATVTPDNLPATKTVDLEEYVAIAQRHGISIDTALAVLLKHILGLGRSPTTLGREDQDERRNVAS